MKRFAYASAIWLVCLAVDAAPMPAVEVVQLRTAAQLASAPKFVQQGEGGGKQVRGLCVDINRAIERQDPGLQITGDQNSLPLTRIEAQMRSGDLDMACGLLRTSERESIYTYVDPGLFTVAYYLVARADDPVEISNWDDVRGLGEQGTILLIRGHGTVSRLKEVGGLRIDAGAGDSKTNLQKLIAGRGRFYYHRVPGIATEIHRAALEGKVRVLPTAMDTQRFHMMVGRHVAPETLDRLKTALTQLAGSGELKRLFDRWFEEAQLMGAADEERYNAAGGDVALRTAATARTPNSTTASTRSIRVNRAMPESAGESSLRRLSSKPGITIKRLNPPSATANPTIASLISKAVP